jgi:hypothetical protein
MTPYRKPGAVSDIACVPVNNLFLGFRGTEGRLPRQPVYAADQQDTGS